MEMNENGVILEGFRMTELGPLPEEWEVVEFKKCVNKGQIKVGKVKQQEYKTYGKYPIIDQGQNLIAGYWDDEKDVYQGKLPVIIFGDHTRIIKYVNFPFVAGADGTKVLSPNISVIFPKFFYYTLLNLKIPSRGYNRHYSLLSKNKFSLPPLLEQQKIAAILSAVQEAKEKTEAVINATRDLKKSMMKYLFTYGPVPVADAENVPLKETEIGMVPEEWAVVRLGDVAGTYSGGTPSRNQKEYFEGEIGWLKSGELNDNYIYSTKEYITEEALKNSSAKYVENNTLLIAMYGATSGKVGLAKTKFTINQAICAINPNSKFCPEFYFFYFQTIRDKLLSMRFGGAQPNLNQQIIKNLKIPLPPLPTQQKIASMLSAIDAKIEAEENKKRALEDLFKALLHNLMTARIRVNHLEVEI